MKYIAKSKLGWDHTPYWDYLESVKRLMPANMHAFASNSENHDLASPNSLHDSWLEYWKVSEILTAERGDRATQIDVCLLGPRHDRYIHLTYLNVEKHGIRGTSVAIVGPRKTPHGDLSVHELAIVRENLFSHELVFSKGTTFSVEFTDFDHRIELRPGT
jgi:hypothetical protein